MNYVYSYFVYNINIIGVQQKEPPYRELFSKKKDLLLFFFVDDFTFDWFVFIFRL